MNERWIKIYARITEWEWYTDPVVFKLFMHLLLRANYKPVRTRGRLYPRGAVLTSVQTLSLETGLTLKNVRTALDKLMSTGEIKVEGANHGSVVTVCNYDTYQADMSSDGQAGGEQVANKGQASGEQVATCIDIKNKRNTEYRVVDDMTRDEFFEAFFSEGRSRLLNEICQSRQLGSLENFRRLATLALAEWEAAGDTHANVADASRHLISHCDIKNKAEKTRTNINNGAPAHKKHSNEKTTAQRPDDSDQRRRQQFRDNIAGLLSTDYTEPDISGCY